MFSCNTGRRCPRVAKDAGQSRVIGMRSGNCKAQTQNKDVVDVGGANSERASKWCLMFIQSYGIR